MLKQLFANLKLHRKTPLALLCCSLASFLIGFLMVYAIVGIAGEETTWFPMGVLLAMVGVAIFVIMSFLSYHQDFNLALSFGCTRKNFMLLYAAEQTICVIAAYLSVIILAFGEEILYSQIFPGMPGEISLVPFLTDWRVFLPSITVLAILPMFLGALYSRFGKRFTVILYVIWLFLCFVAPQLTEQLEQISDYGWLEQIPGFGWILLGLAALAGMTSTIVRLGIKQMVR